MPVCLETLWGDINSFQKEAKALYATLMHQKMDALIDLCDHVLQQDSISALDPIASFSTTSSPFALDSYLSSGSMGISLEISSLERSFSQEATKQLSIAFKDFRSLRMYVPSTSDEDDFL